jgi:hypothetical protein
LNIPPLVVTISGLADGVDQLVSRAALERNHANAKAIHEIKAILPFSSAFPAYKTELNASKTIVTNEISGSNSLKAANERFLTGTEVLPANTNEYFDEFRDLLGRCTEVVELDGIYHEIDGGLAQPAQPLSSEQQKAYQEAEALANTRCNSRPFEAQADVLLRKCDLLIAVDNSGVSGSLGGTADTIRKAINRALPVLIVDVNPKNPQPVIRVIRSEADRQAFLAGQGPSKDWQTELKQAVLEEVDYATVTAKVEPSNGGNAHAQPAANGATNSDLTLQDKFSDFLSEHLPRREKHELSGLDLIQEYYQEPAEWGKSPTTSWLYRALNRLLWPWRRWLDTRQDRYKKRDWDLHMEELREQFVLKKADIEELHPDYTKLKANNDKHFKRADTLAGTCYMPQYRGAYLLNYWLALTALFLAGISMWLMILKHEHYAETAPHASTGQPALEVQLATTRANHEHPNLFQATANEHHTTNIQKKPNYWVVGILILSGIKFLLLLIMLINTKQSHNQHFHKKALNYRYLAELFRSLFFLSPLGSQVPAARLPAQYSHEDPRTSAMNHIFRATARSLPLFMQNAKGGTPPLGERPDYLIEETRHINVTIVWDQLAYQSRKSLQMSHWDAGFDTAIVRTSIAVTLLAFFIFILELSMTGGIIPHLDWLSKWLVGGMLLLVVVLPGYLSNRHGMKHQTEAEWLALRNAAMARRLVAEWEKFRGLETQFAAYKVRDDPGTSTPNKGCQMVTLLANAEDLGQLLVNEVADWRIFYLDNDVPEL